MLLVSLVLAVVLMIAQFVTGPLQAPGGGDAHPVILSFLAFTIIPRGLFIGLLMGAIAKTIPPLRLPFVLPPMVVISYRFICTN
jgi:hypothetical protein